MPHLARFSQPRLRNNSCCCPRDNSNSNCRRRQQSVQLARRVARVLARARTRAWACCLLIELNCNTLHFGSTFSVSGWVCDDVDCAAKPISQFVMSAAAHARNAFQILLDKRVLRPTARKEVAVERLLCSNFTLTLRNSVNQQKALNSRQKQSRRRHTTRAERVLGQQNVSIHESHISQL